MFSLLREKDTSPLEYEGRYADWMARAALYEQELLMGPYAIKAAFGCLCHSSKAFKLDEEEDDTLEPISGEAKQFMGPELTMAAMLGAATWKNGKKATKLVDDALAGGLSTGRLSDAVVEANRIMQTTYDLAADGFEEQLHTVIGRGARRVGMSYADFDTVPSKQAIEDGIIRATRYYTNNYFNTQVVPKLFDEVARILDRTDPTDKPILTSIREIQEIRLKSTPYWRTVANGAASRGYHYGVVKAGQQVGYRGYRLVAVEDDRTTDICLALNGQEFWLADAENYLDRMASVEDTDLVSMFPFVNKAEDVAGKSSEALRDAGHLVPPFHFNCRTTIEFF